MSLVYTSRLFVLTGFLALFAFGSDIIADSVAGSCGNHCVSQSSQSDSDHEKTPCSHCSCCVHGGTVITSTATVHINSAFEVSIFFAAGEQSAPTGLPAAIDHPPQLA
jgi:hypothetical protein